tara:strand:+ start:1175 stop:1624 length:450 start_codon:yes stop_codon:yes gene_type:complete
VRKFRKAHELPHAWATLVLQLRKFRTTASNPEKSAYGQQVLDGLEELIEEYGEELRDAIALVSQADGAINASRSQQISQYHRNRIGKLEKTLEQIDDALERAPGNQDALALAELNSRRQDVAYQLKDHGEKINTRAHGLHLTRMRRKHR